MNRAYFKTKPALVLVLLEHRASLEITSNKISYKLNTRPNSQTANGADLPSKIKDKNKIFIAIQPAVEMIQDNYTTRQIQH